MRDDLVALSLAPVAISKCSGRPAPGYYFLWRAIVEGRISAEKRGRGWFLNPKVAARELGLIGAKATKPAV
jgi:hypothetical protein